MWDSTVRRFKSIIAEFWNERIFKIAITINVIYLIIAIFLTLTFFREFNDFLVYYKVGKVFISDIKTLYDPSNYMWPFRYFPLSAIFFIPFSVLNFELAFLFFSVVNFCINLLICVILYKIFCIVSPDNGVKGKKKIIFYISLYLIALPHVYNYILGQINLLVSILLLLSLYLFLNHEKLRWDIVGGMIIGISINIKPITILIIPFLISFSLSKKDDLNLYAIKKSFTRIGGALFPIFLNGLVFLLIPELLIGFLEINFTGTETLIVNNSFSITKLIINALTMSGLESTLLQELQFVIFLLILSVFLSFGFFVFLFRKLESNSILYGFMLGILTILLAYFDSWDHHLLIFIPLLTISIFSLETENSNSKDEAFLLNTEKKAVYFFIFLDLPLFGLIFLLRDFFPYNFIPPIFLLLLYGSMARYLLREEQKTF